MAGIEKTRIRSARIARMMGSVGGEQGFQYTIHIDPAGRFIFFSNPICACSTLKATLNTAVARAQGVTFRIDGPAMIHDRGANLLQTPAQVGLAAFEAMLDDSKVRKFAFVRGVAPRFVSAFRKKLTYESGFTRRVRAHLGVDPDVPLGAFLTLDRFAEAVARDSTLRDLDEHWRLQRKQIFFDEVPDLDIGFVEDFEADSRRILDGIFGEGACPVVDAVALNPANASRNRGRASGLSDTASAWLAQAYAADNDMIALCRGRKALARQGEEQ